MIYDTLALIFAFFIYPGLVFTVVIGMFFEWVARKTTAKFQHRVGPPLIQPFYDFVKLISKDIIIPQRASRSMFILAPLISLAAVTTVVMFIPIAGPQPIFSFAGDIIVIFYLFVMMSTAIILSGSSSGNPFGAVGASREMTLLLSLELPMIIAVLVPVIAIGSLNMLQIVNAQISGGWFVLQYPFAFIAFLLAMQADLGKLPFDQAEAETEIVDGVYVEYSGGLLGISRLAYDMKIFAMISFFVAMFIGGAVPLVVAGVTIPAVIMLLIKAAIILIVVAAIAGITARVRVGQAFKFFWGVVTPLALIDLVRVLGLNIYLTYAIIAVLVAFILIYIYRATKYRFVTETFRKAIDRSKTAYTKSD
jgi:formate hydrogenlyase subunit 4